MLFALRRSDSLYNICSDSKNHQSSRPNLLVFKMLCASIKVEKAVDKNILSWKECLSKDFCFPRKKENQKLICEAVFELSQDQLLS